MGDQSWGVRSVSTSVVQTVAQATNREPDELEPLYDVVDPDALDALFEGDDASARVRVVFTYEGYQVTVSGAGDVEVATVDDVGAESTATV